MLFPSPVFLSIFLPITFVACAALRKSGARNIALIALSLVFYAWGGRWYVLMLIASAGINWLISLGYPNASKGRASFLTAAAVAFNIGMLGWFKYAAFITRGINIIIAGINLAPLQVPDIALPLGISFFTFQAMSYTFDVRAGTCPPSRNPLDVLLYLCLFPQLIAGPILNWRDVRGQFRVNAMNLVGATDGIAIFARGLAQKVLLADEVARLANVAFTCPAGERGAALAWLGAAAYTLQIYLDFSGYSRMAVGLGKMLGFNFPDNFRTPLASRSVDEFWQRWHITLTSWFRQYVYIPLGGNRCGKAKTLRNLAVVFICTGIWHGAAWTFILWGMWNGLFVILERANIIKANRMPGAVGRLYTLCVAILGFALFRADSLRHAAAYMASMFDFRVMNAAMLSRLIEPLNIRAIVAFTAGAAVSVWPTGLTLERRGAWRELAACAAGAVLLAVSYASILASGYHPFIYFQF